jgi:hypothetical protein
MEPTTYKAVRVERAGWCVQAVCESHTGTVLETKMEFMARRVAALLNLGAHLSVEELESGRQQIAPAAPASA